MTAEKQKLLEELLAGAADTGIKGTLSAFDPSKPYGKRFEVKGFSENIYVDGEVTFDNFALGQRVQVYQGNGAVQWIFSSTELIDRAKLKQSQKQARRLASEKKPKNPTVVKGYDPKKGYLVSEGRSEYPNCKSITTGAIAIGSTVIRKGNLIDQMRIRPGTTSTGTAKPGAKIKYLYTGPTIDGVQSLYAAGWKANLSIKIREFKDGWSLVSALIDNLGGDRFLCSLVASRQKAPNQKEFLCEYYDGSTLQWSVATPFAPNPYGFGFFTGKDQDQVCKVAEGEVALTPYATLTFGGFQNSNTQSVDRQTVLTNLGGSGTGDGGGAVDALFPVSTREDKQIRSFSGSGSSAEFSSFLSPTEKVENSFSISSTSQSDSISIKTSSVIGFVSYYPAFSYSAGGSQFSESSINGSSQSGFSRSTLRQPTRWNSNLESYLAVASESSGNSYSNTEYTSTSSSISIGSVSQASSSSSGPTTTTGGTATSKSAYLRNKEETDLALITNQSIRARAVRDSAQIEIVSGSITPDQYFYSSEFPGNSLLISSNGSQAESSTKALSSTKGTGTEDQRSIILSWAYQPITANTDILDGGVAQVQGIAYTSARIDHDYDDNNLPKTQKVAQLAKEAIALVVPLFDRGFLYQSIDLAKVYPPNLATITTATGSLAFGFLNGSYRP